MRTGTGRVAGGVLAAVGVVVLLAVVAAGQESFRITYDVDRSNPARTRVNGQVANEARMDVVDVYVTAEALDAAGKVVARGITFVSPSLPQGASAAFQAVVPAPPTATTYRVRVSGFRPAFANQAP